MIAFPNAKINLGLNIVSRREDGYHNIESCFYPIPWCDALEVIEAAAFSFHTYGLSIPGENENNLCVKAYKMMQEVYNLPPVEMHLLKHIPMGAGLGGGSADGAFTLKLLNKLFNLNLANDTLADYALKLGSDCPFFIENQPAIAMGRGEHLESIQVDLSGYCLAIYNPGIHISTKEAYQGIAPSQPTLSINSILVEAISDWNKQLSNDFEGPIFQNHPEIKRIKEDMYEEGALYASMTGSGSTVYGIFDSKPTNPAWKTLIL